MLSHVVWAALIAGADCFAAPGHSTCFWAPVTTPRVSIHKALTMPKRWNYVHDCDRPARWRETFDDEGCKVYLQGGQDDVARVPDVGGSSSGADSGYTELVPSLASMEDFVAANQRAASHNKLLIVKFWSKRCRACLRIAANYRRLARKYGDEIECYEMEQYTAGRELLEALSVTQVPTIQIFDSIEAPDLGNRLADLDCQPAQFKEVERTIIATIEARRQERMDLAADGMPGQEGAGTSAERAGVQIDGTLQS